MSPFAETFPARIAKTLILAALLAAGAARAELSAVDVIERSVSAYARMDQLTGRVDFTIVLPDGRRQDKQLAYGRRGASAFQALLLPDGSSGLELIAVDRRIYATQFNVPNSYIEAPYEGDLQAALDRIGAPQVGLELAAPVAAAMTGDVAAFVRGLGFGVLGSLEIKDLETVTEAGETRYQVRLVAENGSCTASFDAASYRLVAFNVVVGEGGHQIRGSGSFVETATSELAARFSFDPRSRQAVSDFAALEASAYPLGQPAPAVSVRALDGRTVSLSDYLGSVVVLDFWATWCVPCWSTLEEVQKLAGWAESADKPVVVLAVNVLEELGDLEQRRKAISGFLDDRGLTLPVVIDEDDSFFAAMHSPGLPSTVLIAPDGTLARYHSGVPDDMAEALRREVEDLLAASRSD